MSMFYEEQKALGLFAPQPFEQLPGQIALDTDRWEDDGGFVIVGTAQAWTVGPWITTNESEKR